MLKSHTGYEFDTCGLACLTICTTSDEEKKTKNLLNILHQKHEALLRFPVQIQSKNNYKKFTVQSL